MIVQSFIFLCFAALLVYCLATKKSAISVFLVSMWLVVAFFGFLYINTSIFYEGRRPMSFLPYIFLFGCFAIYIWPLYNFRVEDIKPFKESRLLIWFFIFCGVISIIPFAENLMHALKSASDPAAFAEFYDRSKSDNSFDMKAHLSVPGRIFTSISIYFQDISPFLLLYYLTFKHINKLILIGLFLFTATPILFMFAAGSRGIPVILGFCFIAYYILLHKHIPENRKNVIGIVFLIGAVFVGVIVSYITISRFGDTEFDISEWIYRYIGEPFPDFNCDGFHTRQHTDGYNCFPFFQHLWNPALPDTRNIMHLSHQTGIRMYVYYTFIGDIYIDFGPIFCVLFILALASIMHVFVKRGNGSYSIPAIIIMGLYLKMGIVGYMFMFTKLQPLMIVMTVILALMLNFFNAFEREEEEA